MSENALRVVAVDVDRPLFLQASDDEAGQGVDDVGCRRASAAEAVAQDALVRRPRNIEGEWQVVQDAEATRGGGRTDHYAEKIGKVSVRCVLCD